MAGMAKEKVTVAVAREKLREAQELIGARSMSEAIDVAIDRLVRAERLRHDVEAYARHPVSDDEVAFASIPVELDLDDDDVDYDALYGGGR
jgi:hypothetical protein